MCAVGQLRLDPVALGGAAHHLLELRLQLLPLVFRVHLGLLQTLQLVGQLPVVALQRLFVLLQVGLELSSEQKKGKSGKCAEQVN